MRLLERLRREDFAGATVIHGVAGSGASSVIHTASLVELSSDLPVLIEVIEDEAHVEKLPPTLDEMVTSGTLVTVERIRVVKYSAAARWSRSDGDVSSATHPNPFRV